MEVKSTFKTRNPKIIISPTKKKNFFFDSQFLKPQKRGKDFNLFFSLFFFKKTSKRTKNFERRILEFKIFLNFRIFSEEFATKRRLKNRALKKHWNTFFLRRNIFLRILPFLQKNHGVSLLLSSLLLFFFSSSSSSSLFCGLE